MLHFYTHTGPIKSRSRRAEGFFFKVRAYALTPGVTGVKIPTNLTFAFLAETEEKRSKSPFKRSGHSMERDEVKPAAMPKGNGVRQADLELPWPNTLLYSLSTVCCLSGRPDRVRLSHLLTPLYGSCSLLGGLGQSLTGHSLCWRGTGRRRAARRPGTGTWWVLSEGSHFFKYHCVPGFLSRAPTSVHIAVCRNWGLGDKGAECNAWELGSKICKHRGGFLDLIFKEVCLTLDQTADFEESHCTSTDPFEIDFTIYIFITVVSTLIVIDISIGVSLM